jgi:hypothetical protein
MISATKGGDMQTSIRYYITRADGLPVGRSIPVALRECETPETSLPAVEPTTVKAHKGLRAPRIVRPALRKPVHVSSEKL